MRGGFAAWSYRMAGKIAVIGAGQMGNGTAHVFAQSGFPVTMIDVSQDAVDKGKETIGKNLDRQGTKGTLTQGDRDSTFDRIDLNTSVDSAADASLVVE